VLYWMPPSHNSTFVTVLLEVGAPLTYFDLAGFSFQVPNHGSCPVAT